MSSNSLSLTNIKNGIYNYLYLINENGEIENIRDLLSSLSSLTNPRFTGGIGINLRNGIDTNDSALFIRGTRNDNPQTPGIRFGTSPNTFGSGQSYGIELCSDSAYGSTIDFTYPDINSYYAGRILFDNSQDILAFYVR